MTYKPLLAEGPVKFTVNGFPEEEIIQHEIENFYRNLLETQLPDNSNFNPNTKKFIVYNTFNEIIFQGSVSDQGALEQFTAVERDTKNHHGRNHEIQKPE